MNLFGNFFGIDLSNPETAAYVIFFVLVACGLGLPVPEDIPLIALGFLWHSQSIGLATALGVGFGGVLIGDSLLYFLGRWIGPTLFRHKLLLKVMSPRKINRTKARFRRYGLWVVFFGRFMMGLRAVVFFTAGATRIPFHKYLWVDFLAALVSIPVWIGLGRVFGEEIDHLLLMIKQGKTIAIWIVLGIIAGYGLLHLIISRRQKNL
jgi:membrane protein DedA with SNARE-associated domain